MRRKDREITDINRIIEIIKESDIIRIGLSDGDYPYIVPLNFGYKINGDVIEFYIHGAMAGRKYELMNKNKKCSFEIDIPIMIDYLYDHKDVTMRYKSVMGTADIEFLEGEDKQKAIDEVIMNRYEEARNFDYNKETVKRTAVAKLTVTSITGKANLKQSGPD